MGVIETLESSHLTDREVPHGAIVEDDGVIAASGAMRASADGAGRSVEGAGYMADVGSSVATYVVAVDTGWRAEGKEGLADGGARREGRGGEWRSATVADDEAADATLRKAVVHSMGEVNVDAVPEALDLPA